MTAIAAAAAATAVAAEFGQELSIGQLSMQLHHLKLLFDAAQTLHLPLLLHTLEGAISTNSPHEYWLLGSAVTAHETYFKKLIPRTLAGIKRQMFVQSAGSVTKYIASES